MSPRSPLLAPGTFLDSRRRGVIERVAAAEHAGILALGSDAPLDPTRRRRVEATLPELAAQPEAVRATWARNAAGLEEVAGLLASRAPDRAWLVGAGDSLAVMIAARPLLERMLGVPCEPIQSLEFAYYASGACGPRSAVVTLSSSGETTRTVEAALVAQHRGALTLAVTNTPGSTLDRESERTLLVEATRVGWPTQSSTAALAALLRVGVAAGAARGARGADSLAAALDAVPDAMAAAIEMGGPWARRVAEREAAGSMYLFSGGGPSWATAIAGAAKVKECTPDHALAIQVEEYHHYSSQKAGEPLVLVAPAGPTVARACDTASEARRFGGRVHAVTTAGEDAFGALADTVLHVPAVPEELSALVTMPPAQLIGVHLAMAKFAAAEAAE